jgi:hypothetical protein
MIQPFYGFYGVVVDRVLILEFSAAQCVCWSNNVSANEGWHHTFNSVCSMALNGLPCFSLFLVNTFLVVYAVKKSINPVNKKNIVVVVLITASFLISVLPYFAYFVLNSTVWDDTDPVLRFVTFVMFLSFWSNPIIYFFTNERFQKFTIRVLTARARVYNYDTTIGNTLNLDILSGRKSIQDVGEVTVRRSVTCETVIKTVIVNDNYNDKM